VALFEQVFGDRKAFAAYRQAGNLGQVEVVIERDAGFQGLHWEAMWDGERSGTGFAKDFAAVELRLGVGRRERHYNGEA
jgi:hypothetical protein